MKFRPTGGAAYKEFVSLGAEAGAKEFAKIKEKLKTETRLSMLLKTSGFEFLWKIWPIKNMKNVHIHNCIKVLNFNRKHF